MRAAFCYQSNCPVWGTFSDFPVMARLVLKFGGTSVADLERIRNVARHVKREADAGHQVFGVAQTHKEAVAIGTDGRPDLILADIRLADESSGIDAVNDLLKAHGDVPVIFITAYPERLLTGEKPEPAFLITKPFRADQVLSAISQAMFFSSTETLV